MAELRSLSHGDREHVGLRADGGAPVALHQVPEPGAVLHDERAGRARVRPAGSRLASSEASRPRTMVATSPGSTWVAPKTSMLETNRVKSMKPSRRRMKRVMADILVPLTVCRASKFLQRDVTVDGVRRDPSMGAYAPRRLLRSRISRPGTWGSWGGSGTPRGSPAWVIGPRVRRTRVRFGL